MILSISVSKQLGVVRSQPLRLYQQQQQQQQQQTNKQKTQTNNKDIYIYMGGNDFSLLHHLRYTLSTLST